MQRQLTEGEVIVEDIVADVFAFNISGAWSPSKRLALAAVVPLIARAGGEVSVGGPALGDVRLWAPIALLKDEALHVDLIPSVGLPTGSAPRNLGAGVVTGELSANVGWHPGQLKSEIENRPEVGASALETSTASSGSASSGATAFGVLAIPETNVG